MNNKVNKFKIILTFILIILIPIIIFYSSKILSPSSPLFSINENTIYDYVKSWGIYGSIIFIFIQAFTIVFPPAPNLIPMIAGGILFGVKLGILLSFIGVMVGISVNFYLTRIFGRRIIEKILNKQELSFIDKFVDKINWRIITLFPFIPGMYADLGGYSAGLSKMSFKKYFFAIGLGYLILVSFANILGRIVIQNEILRGVLITVLIIGMVSIFLILLFRFLKKRMEF